MPELPELAVLARQMARELLGKPIAGVDVRQPKCLNMPPEQMINTLSGKRVGEITSKGKWLFVSVEPGHTLLINLGMGADLLYCASPSDGPDVYQFRVDLDDGTGFTIRFWWFGYVHLVRTDELRSHAMTSTLGPSALDPDFTLEAFRKLLEGRRGMIKAFLLNQRNLAGIGNAYVHDILFGAGIHPQRPIQSLSAAEIDALYASVRRVLEAAIHSGAAYYEKDFYGRPGGYTEDQWAVGYREGEPCPKCGTSIVKIKTGSTSSFICPTCQPLNPHTS